MSESEQVKPTESNAELSDQIERQRKQLVALAELIEKQEYKMLDMKKGMEMLLDILDATGQFDNKKLLAVSNKFEGESKL